MGKLKEAGHWMAIKLTYAGVILLGLVAVLDVFGIVLARPGAIVPVVFAAGVAALMPVQRDDIPTVKPSASASNPLATKPSQWRRCVNYRWTMTSTWCTRYRTPSTTRDGVCTSRKQCPAPWRG